MFLTPLLDQMLDRVREPDSSANPVTISRVYSDIYHFYVRIPNFLAGDGGLETGDRHGGTGGVECVFTAGRSSARFGRGRARSPTAVSVVPSPARPTPGGELSRCRGLAAADSRHPAPGGVDSVMSPQLALCELSSRGLSSDGLCRAEFAWREMRWIVLSGPGPAAEPESRESSSTSAGSVGAGPELAGRFRIVSSVVVLAAAHVQVLVPTSARSFTSVLRAGPEPGALRPGGAGGRASGLGPGRWAGPRRASRPRRTGDAAVREIAG